MKFIHFFLHDHDRLFKFRLAIAIELQLAMQALVRTGTVDSKTVDIDG